MILPVRPIKFYDAGNVLAVTWVDDGKSDLVMDQDQLDEIRWMGESPNAEPFYHNPWENLKSILDGEKIFLKSGRILRRSRRRKNDYSTSVLQLVEDDGVTKRFRLGDGKRLDKRRKIT